MFFYNTISFFKPQIYDFLYNYNKKITQFSDHVINS